MLTIADYANGIKISNVTIQEGYADGDNHLSLGGGVIIGKNARHSTETL